MDDTLITVADTYRDHLAAANDLRLPPKPLPAVPYDAKTKAAA